MHAQTARTPSKRSDRLSAITMFFLFFLYIVFTARYRELVSRQNFSKNADGLRTNGPISAGGRAEEVEFVNTHRFVRHYGKTAL